MMLLAERPIVPLARTCMNGMSTEEDKADLEAHDKYNLMVNGDELEADSAVIW